MSINPDMSRLGQLSRNAARRSAYAALSMVDASEDIEAAAAVAAEALLAGNKILACGNGGSAATAQHFAAEFSGKLCLDRRPLAALALHTDTSALTAIGNDYGFEHIFSRQVGAIGRQGDVLFGFSTSGKSKNVVAAIEQAHSQGMRTIGVSGATNLLGADISITVPLKETARVQEAHDLVLHAVAQIVERIVIPELGNDSSADPFPFVLPESQISGYRAWIETTEQKLVSTNGVFDLLHKGHRSSLKTARTIGDQLVVIVNSDASVKRLKGDGRPVNTLEDRVETLELLPYVDHVVVMDDDNPSRLLSMLKPHTHCKGSEYKDRAMPEREVVESYGGTIEFISLVSGYSTTAQINNVLGGPQE